MADQLKTTRISKRTVDALEPPLKGEVWIWDDTVKGFFVRVYPSGRKTYALKYRIGKKQAIFTIGSHGSPWTPEQARAAAISALEGVRRNVCPAAHKAALKQALTVSELIERYLEEGPLVKPDKRKSSWDTDASNLKRHIKPLLGGEIATNLTKHKAARALGDIAKGSTATIEKSDKARGKAIVKGGQGIATRVKAVASAMYSWGIEAGLVTDNPFKSIKMPTQATKERFLSVEEANAFLRALNDLVAMGEIQNVYADAIRILLTTGARKTEIAALRWNEINWSQQSLILPPDRTKAGGKTGTRRVTLMPIAISILRTRMDEAEGQNIEKSPYVFTSPRTALTTGGPIVGIRRIFLKVCERAGIKDIRLHDLRHSFASFAIGQGTSLFSVSKLLGHASSRTTERYAHLADQSLRGVVDDVGLLLTSA